MERPKLSIPSHTYEATDNKNIQRFLDRNGDWTHYYIKPRKLFVPAVNHVIRVGYPKGERFYDYLLGSRPEEAERKLRTAGVEGARTHEAIRDLILGKRVTLESTYYNSLTDRYESLTRDEWQNLEAFVRWVEKYKPQVIVQEHAVWSPAFRYAGTLDFIGTILIPEGDKYFPKELGNKRISILLDWKTSSAIYDEYELQVAAYRHAIFETEARNVPIKSEAELWTGIVRLGTSHKSGYEMKTWTPDQSDTNLALFMSVLDIYAKKSGDEFEPEITEIPSELQVDVPVVEKIKKRRNKSAVRRL